MLTSRNYDHDYFVCVFLTWLTHFIVFFMKLRLIFVVLVFYENISYSSERKDNDISKL
jgi:hypothetical protein